MPAPNESCQHKSCCARFRQFPDSVCTGSTSHWQCESIEASLWRLRAELQDSALSTDASHKRPPTARRIDASSIASRSDAIAEALPRGIGEEKARGRGRLWRGRAVDAEDEEEEGASAASYAVDASSPLTRRCPRRKRRRMTSPAWRAPGTPPTRAKKRGRRSVEARKSGSAAPAPPLSQAVA